MAIQNGDVISNKDIKWIEMEQLNTHIGKPFQLLYSGSKAIYLKFKSILNRL